MTAITSWLDVFSGPKYDGKYLHSLLNSLLGDLTLKQTLTNVVIPAFDIKLLQPVIFYTHDVRIRFVSAKELYIYAIYASPVMIVAIDF